MHMSQAVVRWWIGAVMLSFAALFGSSVAAQPRKTIDVADVIAMRKIGDPADFAYLDQDIGYDTWQSHKAEFSPDGRYAAVIVTWGDLSSNTNKAELIVFHTTSMLQPGIKGEIVATAQSRNNRPPIQSVRWLGDNRRITYLAETNRGPQVFETAVDRPRQKAMTNLRATIVAYDVTPSGNRLALLALEPSAAADQKARLVTDLNLNDVIFGDALLDYGLQTSSLYVQDRGKSARKLPQVYAAALAGGTKDEFGIGRCNPLWGGVSISPDGKYAVRTCALTSVPARWRTFENVPYAPAAGSSASGGQQLFQLGLNNALKRNAVSDRPASGVGMGDGAYLQQNVAFSLSNGEAHVIVDAPLNVGSWSMYRSRAWLPNSHIVLVTDSPLPAGDGTPFDPAPHVISVDLASGAKEVIAKLHRDPLSLWWDSRNNGLSVDFNGVGMEVKATQDHSYIRPSFFAWTGSKFEPRMDVQPVSLDGNGNMRVRVVEDLQHPPKLIAQSLATGQQNELLDPNPFLAERSIGKISTINWSDGNATWIAGVYFPPNYVAGKRYPLVIQTHGFSPARFSLYGDAKTGMAAEPLAAEGIIVVQMGSYDDQIGPLKISSLPRLEASQKRIEALIDDLDKKGVIDPTRVGLTGFSSTCWPVKYLLAHTKYPIAAAVLGDGAGGGYMEYMMFASEQIYAEQDYGSAPFGDGLQVWIRQSPEFAADRIKTPIRIEANKPYGILPEWEMFAALKRLGKPVELYFHPTGAHEEIRPSDRYASSQGALDWYRYWLLGKHPNAPASITDPEALAKLSDEPLGQ